MIKYRPGKRRRVNPLRLGIAIAVVAVIVILIVVFVNGGFGKKEDEIKGEEAATFSEGVIVAGVDVAGMTIDKAEETLTPIANQMLKANEISFKVEEKEMKYPLADVGTSVDIKTVLDEAILFGKDKSMFEKNKEVPTQNYEIKYVLDEAVLKTKIDEESKDWNIEPVNATFEVKTDNNEEDLTTDGEIITTDGVSGYNVNTDEVITEIKTQVETNTFAPFVATVTEIKPEIKKEDLDKLEVIGDYYTEYSSKSASVKERMYNIWKISASLNGAVIEPWSNFSVNEHVGDRTEEKGWKLANGIENGDYTLQAGGGICQVSTTMYNAALIAEMKMVKRVPHTIPSSYVPLGLDATISTGGPDFEVQNNSDYPVAMIVKCNVPDRKVRVVLYGHKPRDYTLKFSSELAKETPEPAVNFKVNSTMTPGTYQLKLKGRTGKVAYIYQQKFDLDGNALGEKVHVNESNYKPIAPVVEIASDIPVPPAGTTYADFVAQRAAAAPQVTQPPDIPDDPAPPASQNPAPPAPTPAPTPAPPAPTPAPPAPTPAPPAPTPAPPAPAV